MGISNLLDSVSVGFLDGVVLDKIGMSNLNWIGKIIQWLIEGVGIVGIGIIVFTLILKTIVLPLDVFSRIKTKKQSLMMEKMRPQMEKLQKQYANDKQMYSQKVMELQKQNGFSMIGACLPMVVSLVIFMVVFSAFSTYSQHANLSTYNNMVEEYNASVSQYVYTDVDNTVIHEDGFLIAETDLSTNKVEYKVNFDKFMAYYNADKSEDKLALPEGFSTVEDYFASLKSESEKKEAVGNYIRVGARKASAAYYRSNKDGFIWVGNIWYPDSMLNKEVPNFSKFSSSVSRAVGSGVDASYEASYNEVVANLGKELKTYNGYFVLIV
ncbi:MAG: YidC/Oxa1 family membrane protein insertase, partial [Clostridia bacterium]|nr:YidC/Oxa1 family membrane protein insertase [Clostridia bacterium]